MHAVLVCSICVALAFTGARAQECGGFKTSKQTFPESRVREGQPACTGAVNAAADT